MNEEYLELFFESKKKVGAGTILEIQFNREKHWAIVAFTEPDAVDTVLGKTPLTLMNNELDIHPYTPICKEGERIDSLEIKGLPTELTEQLVSKDIEEKVGSAEASSAEYISDNDNEDSDKEGGEESDSTTGEIVEQITDIQPVKLRLFVAMNDDEEIAEKFPNAKMRVNKKKNEIHFFGSVVEIQSLKLEVYKKLINYSVYTYHDIGPDSIKLFQSPKVAEHIKKKLSSKNLVCEWKAIDTALIICSTEEAIAKCCNIVRESVKEVTFSVCNESAVAFLPSEWQRLQDQLHEDNEFVCNVNTTYNKINVHIVAEHDTVDIIVRDIDNFVLRHTNIGSECICFNQLALVENKLDGPQARRILRKIISGLEMYYVSFNQVGNSSSFNVKGTSEGRELVKKRIRKFEF